jgi:tetratricopeptide (TPR) repeat protein
MRDRARKTRIKAGFRLSKRADRLRDRASVLDVVRLALALLAFVMLWTESVQAETPHQRAFRLVQKSSAEYEAGRFQEAIQLLEQAWAIERNPTILYNEARAYEGLGDLERALDSYRKYVEREPNAPDRGAVEQRISTLDRQIQATKKLEREKAEAAKREAEAKRRAEAERAARKREKNSPTTRAESGSGIAPWLLVGGGAAVIGVGGVFGLTSRSNHRRAVDAPLAQDSADLNQSARSQATVANVCFAAGGLLAAGGLVWVVVDPFGGERNVERASVALALGPASVGARGRF